MYRKYYTIFTKNGCVKLKRLVSETEARNWIKNLKFNWMKTNSVNYKETLDDLGNIIRIDFINNKNKICIRISEYKNYDFNVPKPKIKSRIDVRGRYF